MLHDFRRLKFPSDSTGYTYDLKVYVPDSEEPSAGFPVYYILDGLSYFQFAKDVVRLQSRNTLKTGVSPGAVIGICHAEQDMRQRRFFDFTAPALDYAYPDRLKGRDCGPHGGAKDFICFLEQELMPFIGNMVNVDRQRQTLFGHSLGGYFSLYALFTKPNLFNTYLACSPSIWWNRYELFGYADTFISQSAIVPRIQITVGEKEGFMVEDAVQMEQRLRETGRDIGFFIAPEENHASIVPTIMSRAIRFADN